MIAQKKKEIREFILNKRDSVDENIRKDWDKVIFDKVINSNYYKEAKSIFVFVSFGTEVDTHKIINHALANGKTICVPKIPSKKVGIEIYKINSFDDLKEGYFKVLEPKDNCPLASGDDMDLILMPGLAFDRDGGRIGYGAGFYDRFLEKMIVNVDKIAIAYDFQLMDNVPTNELDVRIDGIITQEKTIIF